MDAEIFNVNRLNEKIISALGRRECDAAHRLARRALEKLSALTSRCHTNQFDKLYIAFANTYCNLACIYRSQKKGTRAKLSIGYAISFSQQIQNKKERILNVITTLINLTVIDSELNHSVLAIGHASRACLIILNSMNANFVTENGTDNIANEFCD